MRYIVRVYDNLVDFQMALNTKIKDNWKIRSWQVYDNGGLRVVAVFEDYHVGPRTPAIANKVIEFPTPGGCVSVPVENQHMHGRHADREGTPAAGKYHVG